MTCLTEDDLQALISGNCDDAMDQDDETESSSSRVNGKKHAFPSVPADSVPAALPNGVDPFDSLPLDVCAQLLSWSVADSSDIRILQSVSKRFRNICTSVSKFLPPLDFVSSDHKFLDDFLGIDANDERFLPGDILSVPNGITGGDGWSDLFQGCKIVGMRFLKQPAWNERMNGTWPSLLAQETE